jgi:hypothetical protein
MPIKLPPPPPPPLDPALGLARQHPLSGVCVGQAKQETNLPGIIFTPGKRQAAYPPASGGPFYSRLPRVGKPYAELGKKGPASEKRGCTQGARSFQGPGGRA